jgi:proteasome lid subunit RPN8/RPN11
MVTKLEISSGALDAIRTHAASDPGREVCGLLFGSSDRIETTEAVANIAEDPTRHFEIDPAALFRAIRAERAGGPKLLGYYHSHPAGRAEPSATDQEMSARDGKIWLIVAGGEVTAWRAGADGLKRLALSHDRNQTGI